MTTPTAKSLERCECKIEVCAIDATECGGSWHTTIRTGFAGESRLVHFKRCFQCRQEQETVEERLTHSSDVCREQQYRITQLERKLAQANYFASVQQQIAGTAEDRARQAFLAHVRTCMRPIVMCQSSADANAALEQQLHEADLKAAAEIDDLQRQLSEMAAEVERLRAELQAADECDADYRKSMKQCEEANRALESQLEVAQQKIQELISQRDQVWADKKKYREGQFKAERDLEAARGEVAGFHFVLQAFLILRFAASCPAAIATL